MEEHENKAIVPRQPSGWAAGSVLYVIHGVHVSGTTNDDDDVGKLAADKLCEPLLTLRQRRLWGDRQDVDSEAIRGL